MHEKKSSISLHIIVILKIYWSLNSRDNQSVLVLEVEDAEGLSIPTISQKLERTPFSNLCNA